MKPEAQDGPHLWDMLEAARETVSLVEGFTLETLLDDARTKRAIERTLEVLGEAASRVSFTTKKSHGAIPWSRIIGQRNVIAHGYAVVDHGRLFATIRDDLPGLITQLDVLVQKLQTDADE